ncbi:MAG: CoB--CoM heterodisulfide reductase iron-sulfur subunit A family protein [Promethearchaeota archaeon]
MEQEKKRIGVFVCKCGSNIGGVIDCDKLSQMAGELPGVEFSQSNLYTCSETGLSNIKIAIEEHNLSGVIVAACTPRTHEPLFRGICQEKGLNPYLFEFVNIREQCSWVHSSNREEAFKKAYELIKMGLAKAKLLNPLEKPKVSINSSALVIGGGIAGMTSALNLGNRGFPVYLIEKQEKLGGRLNKLAHIFPHNMDPAEILKIRDDIFKNSNITVLTETKITNIGGYIGNFNISYLTKGQNQTVTVGAIIVATGTDYFTPTNYYNYNGKNIITQQELELRFKEGNFNSTHKNIVMIQCVSSRQEGRQYCSNVCCISALKNATILKEKHPELNIIILYRDLFTPGVLGEEIYRKTRELGVIFIHFDPSRPPKVENNKVIVFSEAYQTDLKLDYDLIVLAAPMVAHKDVKELSQWLKVPIDEYGFFLEAHVKLKPIDFSTDGIFLAGSARWPTNISNAIAQGNAAASHAAIIISKQVIEVEGNVAEINQDLCIGCGICEKICPYSAIARNEEDEMVVQSVLCKGCGLCGATCPQEAIKIKHFTDGQILAQIEALTGGH